MDRGANLDLETGEGAHVLLWKRDDSREVTTMTSTHPTMDAKDRVRARLVKNRVFVSKEQVLDVIETRSREVFRGEQPEEAIEKFLSETLEGRELYAIYTNAAIPNEALEPEDEPEEVRKTIYEIEKMARDEEQAVGETPGDVLAEIEKEGRALWPLAKNPVQKFMGEHPQAGEVYKRYQAAKRRPTLFRQDLVERIIEEDLAPVIRKVEGEDKLEREDAEQRALHLVPGMASLGEFLMNAAAQGARVEDLLVGREERQAMIRELVRAADAVTKKFARAVDGPVKGEAALRAALDFDTSRKLADACALEMATDFGGDAA